ncbi:MAG: YpmA family protein [Syntrophomonadaceae bacterium]|nr:YpmA family protein [Syntrophomonadaceae bacterium]
MDKDTEVDKADKLDLIATKSFAANPDLVYVIDFLNRSLKHKKVMFGLKKSKESNEMIINIYEY